MVVVFLALSRLLFFSACIFFQFKKKMFSVKRGFRLCVVFGTSDVSAPVPYIVLQVFRCATRWEEEQDLAWGPC
jgi:hypothetical protein